MISEKDFENIICKYPELIEENLVFIGRQIRVHGKIMDILFHDKFGQKLIVELKIGPITRKHIGQVMEYEGSVLSVEDPTARVMLIGNRVPPSFQKALDHHGIEWKEIVLSQLKKFLEKKKDEQFLKMLPEETAAIVTNENTPEETRLEDDNAYTVDFYLNKAEDQNMLTMVNDLRQKIKEIDANIIEYCRKGWIQFKVSKIFCGISICKQHSIVSIRLQEDKFRSDKFDLMACNTEPEFTKIKIKPATNLGSLLKFIKMAYEESLSGKGQAGWRSRENRMVGSGSKGSELILNLLKEQKIALTMPEIKKYMWKHGFKSRTFYDWSNGLVAKGLASVTTKHGKKAYILKELHGNDVPSTG